MGGFVRRSALAAGVITVLALVTPASAQPSPQTTPRSVLVVGDSVVAQAAQDIHAYAPPGTVAWAAGGPGTAPCDWWQGKKDPYTGTDTDFPALIRQIKPAAVVLAFSGNPGLDGTRYGCVDANAHYSLDDLLATYRSNLTAMAAFATANGAKVYFAASPPRNPATPPGVYVASNGEQGYGFNGDPAVNQLYQQIADSPQGVADGWVYDTSAAVAVSDLGMTWQLDETCMPWDVESCRLPAGTVQVRMGGHDSIHLDPYGNGAKRYAQGIIRQPLENQLS